MSSRKMEIDKCAVVGEGEYCELDLIQASNLWSEVPVGEKPWHFEGV